MLKHYRGSMIFAGIAAVLGYVLAGLPGALIVLILSVLETSLSFDNAVVNASILKSWDSTWRKRFLTWGMPVAVFGMRLVFPLLIVAIIGGLTPIGAVQLAISEPSKYAEILSSAHYEISGFGGAFLLMVFLKFFLDAEKDEHWISWLESSLIKVGRLDMIQAAITLSLIVGFSYLLEPAHRFGFVTAGVWGLITYILADAVGSLVGSEEGSSRIIQQSVGGFLYLELLDASFSFDGVIGALALSDNIFIIALGLGVGAMFVRSMTLHLVEKGALDTFKWLEHGAFYAIGTLAVIMLVSSVIHVPEVVTGLIGAGFIGLALWSSVKHNRSQPQVKPSDPSDEELRKAA